MGVGLGWIGRGSRSWRVSEASIYPYDCEVELYCTYIVAQSKETCIHARIRRKSSNTSVGFMTLVVCVSIAFQCA